MAFRAFQLEQWLETMNKLEKFLSYQNALRNQHWIIFGGEWIRPSPVSLQHWYKIDYWECPYCGKESQNRVRIYTTKPENRNDRISYTQAWCGCSYV